MNCFLLKELPKTFCENLKLAYGLHRQFKSRFSAKAYGQSHLKATGSRITALKPYQELVSMQTVQPRFCFACGALIQKQPRQPGFWRHHLFHRQRCHNCGVSLSFSFWYPWLVGGWMGFLAGLGIVLWQNSTPQPVQFPQLTTGSSNQTLPQTNTNSTAQAPRDSIHSSQPTDESHVCGAKTKSGRPCRRKVRGTQGYCWQHRKSTDQR